MARWFGRWELPTVVIAALLSCGGGSSRRTCTLTQGQVVFAAQRLTAGELAAARRARGLLTDPAALAFADALIAGQESAQRSLDEVASCLDDLSPSRTSRQLDAWFATLDLWLDRQGRGFDEVFLAKQARDLAGLLQVLEEVLIPNTTDRELLEALQRLRDSVAAFLHLAAGLASDAVGASTR